MRSGSPAQDGEGRPSSQRPYPDEATSGPVRYGSGPRSDPREGQGGRRDVPFGPEISWPYGFRQLDPESRQILESAYGTGPAHQQPAADDFGYGDPGYSDPSYEGTPYGGHASPGQSGGHRAAAPRAFGGSGYPQPEPPAPRYHVPAGRASRPPPYPPPGHQPPAHAPPSRRPQLLPRAG